MKFIDWFAGIGGFRRGMELAGHQCVGFCEFDKYAVASYTSMHLITEKQRKELASLELKKRQKEILKDEYRNKEWYAPDVVRVHAADIPRADCWCFGFPCQDISVAGKQKGFEGNRSSLFFRITGLLKQLSEEDRPHTLFIENVKNLLSISEGRDFATVLNTLDEIGYDAEWTILNSKDFGVPQNRERCFIIGHLRGRGGREVFPLRRDAEQIDIQEVAVDQIASMGSYHESTQAYRVYDKEGLAPTLGTMQGGGLEPHIVDSNHVKRIGGIENSSQRYQVYDDNGLSPTLDTSQGGGREPHVKVEGFNTEDDGTSRTIKYQYQKNSAPNFIDRGDRGATAVIVKEDNHDLKILNRGEECESKRIYDPKGIIATIAARDYKDAKKIAIPCLTPDRVEKRQNGRRFKEDGDPMFTLTAQDKHGVVVCEERSDEGLRTFKDNCCGAIRSQPDGGKKRILIAEATAKGYQEAEEEEEDSINFSVLGSKTRRGRVGKGVAQTLDTGCQQGVLVKNNDSGPKILNHSEECESKGVYDPSEIKSTITQDVKCININNENGKERPQQDRIYSEDGVMTALNAQLGGRHNIATSYRIRKLTPKECFRLQGWTDDYFEKAAFVNSNAQLYKQAGNGVTVNVIYQIAKRLEEEPQK